MIRGVTRIFFVPPVLAAVLLPPAGADAGTKYDGSWSVVVSTTAGPCEPSSRFSGQIVNGEFSYAYGTLEVNGHVDANGTTIVRVSYGDSHGEAHGHMTATQGGGTWSGDGPGGRCSGTWSATRPGTS